MTSAPAVSGRAWLHRHRAGLAVTAMVLAVVVVLSLLTLGSGEHGGALDPDSSAPGGARAVARVLDRRGVDVSVVRDAAGFAAARISSDTTVLVTSTGALGRRTARELDHRTASAGALVLAEPGATAVRALRLPLAAEPASAVEDTPASCPDTALTGLSVDVGPSTGYRGTRGASVESCFPVPGARPSALVVRVDRIVPTYAVGGTGMLTNGAVLRADNAAAALRLLGQHARLVWYVPDARDVAAGDAGSLSAQLPGGLGPALWLLAASVVGLVLWRGRRLGPLVTEPLPVVVKAVEATQGRGRLYRRVRDRTHVAAVLRRATTRRLATDLRLPRSTTVGPVVAAVAAATRRDPAEVDDVLTSRAVHDDAGLVRLAADLAALEREVHRP